MRKSTPQREEIKGDDGCRDYGNGVSIVKTSKRSAPWQIKYPWLDADGKVRKKRCHAKLL